MREVNQFEGMKVLVLGLAKSGYAAAGLLHATGADVTVNDASPAEGQCRSYCVKQARDCCHLRRSSRGHHG